MLASPLPQERVPPHLYVFNTKCETTPSPVKASFSFSSAHVTFPTHLLSEPCGYTPSPDELATAPFYPDPSHRILAVGVENRWWYVINAELLLELARERRGQNVGWDEWRTRCIPVSVKDLAGINSIWVSGCRLFCAVSRGTDGSQAYLRIHDFNRACRAKNLDTPSGIGMGGRSRETSPDLNEYQLPWNASDLRRGTMTTAHDSIILCVVSILIALPRYTNE